MAVAEDAKQLLTILSRRGTVDVRRGDLGFAGVPGRVLTPASGLSLPAVVFAHDWLSSSADTPELVRHLASWGFVVLAVDSERSPFPSHQGFADDLSTTLDIATGVRLGDGGISVHPDKLALVGHGFGASVAAMVAARRPVRAVAALFPTVISGAPAPALPLAAEGTRAARLLVAGGDDWETMNSAVPALAEAWGEGTAVRTLDGATGTQLRERGFGLRGLDLPKPKHRTQVLTRALLTGFLLATVAGDRRYAAFADVDLELKHVAGLPVELSGDDAAMAAAAAEHAPGKLARARSGLTMARQARKLLKR